MHSTGSYLRRLAGLVTVFAAALGCSYIFPPLAALPSMVIAYHEYWKAFGSRRTLQGAVRLQLCAILLIAWDAAVAALLCSVLGYSLRDVAVQQFCCMFHWVAVFLSVGWPTPHVTGPRIHVLQLLYDLPLFAAVLIAKLTGERLNTLYSKVDGNLLLGSLPFPEDVPRLQREGVVAVVNMCREWPGPEREYKAAGITQLRLPTPDLSMPRLEDVAAALEFISEHVDRGKVFVHCRFGMGRSASIVLAFLARHRAMPTAQSIHYVRARRPEVLHSVSRSPVVRSFEE